MLTRVTPENIQTLHAYRVFVFGSNLAGRHGKGAALQAAGWGARRGQGSGRMGNSYAIPTKGFNLEVLPLAEIGKYVDEFIDHALANPDWLFLVTEIGCGLAGYKPIDIAPLFARALVVNNIWLPQSFIAELYAKNG